MDLKQWVSGVRIPLNHLQSLQPVFMAVSVRVKNSDGSCVLYAADWGQTKCSECVSVGHKCFACKHKQQVTVPFSNVRWHCIQFSNPYSRRHPHWSRLQIKIVWLFSATDSHSKNNDSDLVKLSRLPGQQVSVAAENLSNSQSAGTERQKKMLWRQLP